jgi:formate dehydrogenase major subunit
MYVVDPRLTDSARFADAWLGIDVGTDIALANALAREIIASNLYDPEFVRHATTGFEQFAEHVDAYTLEYAAEVTGVDPISIKDLAHRYATAQSAQILWTLGITEHHNGVENVLSLCNLALLTGHVGRWGSGLVPLRGQNNVQGGGDMGALPNKLPGFQDVDDPIALKKFEELYGVELNPQPGLHLTLMFEAMAKGELTGLYIIGENPAESEADVQRARELLKKLDFLVVQDIFMTRTAELADVVLPASVGWAESEGTVTSSERRVQRVRAALRPPEGARHDHEIIGDLAERMNVPWPARSPEELWDELRSLSSMHKGMTYARLDEHQGLQWPCPDDDHPGTPYLHSWLWDDNLGGREPAPFSLTVHSGPKEQLSSEFPLRLTTGRVLDSYNTGVQSRGYNSPIRSGSSLEISSLDADDLGLDNGDEVLVSSPRGSVKMTITIQRGQPQGLAFTTFHFPDLVDLNVLTNDQWDPLSGTAEFKAAAIRIDKLTDNDRA